MGKNTAKINKLREKISHINVQIKEQTKNKGEMEKEAENLEFEDWKFEFKKLGITPDDIFFNEIGRFYNLKRRGITIDDIEEMFSDINTTMTGEEKDV